MSSGQALAAAQRRRAGGAKNAPATRPDVRQQRPENKPPVSMEALVSMHDRQLYDVGKYILSNDEHWRDSDDMLRILSERCDELSKQLGRSSSSDKDVSDKSVKELEDKVSKKVDELALKSSTREEVMELVGNVRQDMDTNLNKVTKLESEVTKLRSVIMQLQKDVTSLKEGEANK